MLQPKQKSGMKETPEAGRRQNVGGGADYSAGVGEKPTFITRIVNSPSVGVVLLKDNLPECYSWPVAIYVRRHCKAECLRCHLRRVLVAFRLVYVPQPNRARRDLFKPGPLHNVCGATVCWIKVALVNRLVGHRQLKVGVNDFPSSTKIGVCKWDLLPICFYHGR